MRTLLFVVVLSAAAHAERPGPLAAGRALTIMGAFSSIVGLALTANYVHQSFAGLGCAFGTVFNGGDGSDCPTPQQWQLTSGTTLLASGQAAMVSGIVLWSFGAHATRAVTAPDGATAPAPR